MHEGLSGKGFHPPAVMVADTAIVFQLFQMGMQVELCRPAQARAQVVVHAVHDLIERARGIGHQGKDAFLTRLTVGHKAVNAFFHPCDGRPMGGQQQAGMAAA